MAETFVLGAIVPYAGNVARLGPMGAKAPPLVERHLGFGPGRLAQGYAIAALIEPLRARDVEFDGLTLRSGGRDGLPQADPKADTLRMRVHCRMVEEQGQAEVDRRLDLLAADGRNLSGRDRIIKIRPVTPHRGVNPAEEYPMGDGHGQWLLKKTHKFRIIAVVDKVALATTAAGWSVSIAAEAPYDGRDRLRRYLETA